MISWSAERLPARGALRPQGSATALVWSELGRALVPGPPRDDGALRESELDAAYLRGRAEGEQSAQARARREVASALAAARSVVREVREERAAWTRALEENLAALATALAARLVQRELAADPAAHLGMVRHALASFPPRHEVRVHVHPSDLAALDALGPAGGDDGERDVRWVADEAVAPGGCLVEGPERIVDGRLDEGLKRIWQELAHG